MRELVRLVAPVDHEPERERLVERVERDRLLEVRRDGRVVQPERALEHRRRAQELASGLAQPAEPPGHDVAHDVGHVGEELRRCALARLDPLERSRLDEVDERRLHEERVPAGLGADRATEPVGRARERLLDELGDRVGVEGVDDDAVRSRLAGHRAHGIVDVRVGLGGIVAPGQDDEQVGTRDRRRQVPERGQRPVVGPLQVVDDQHDGPLERGGEHRAAEVLAHRHGLVARTGDDMVVEAALESGAELVGHEARELRGDVGERAVRRAPLRLTARPPEDRRPARLRPRHQFAGETGLAHPGVAGDERDRARPRSGGAHELLERVEVPVAADDAPPARVHDPRPGLRFVAEEGQVERLGLRCRVDAQLLGQQPAAALVGAQRLGPVATRGVGCEQQPVRRLAVRLEPHRLGGDGGRERGLVEVEPGPGEQLEGADPGRVQVVAELGHPRPVLTGEELVAEHHPGVGGEAGGLAEVAGIERGRGPVERGAGTEHVDVEGDPGGELQAVPVTGVAHHVAGVGQQPGERRPDLGHDRADAGAERGRGTVGPEDVDEPVAGDGLVAGEDEQGEGDAGAPAAEVGAGELGPVAPGGERPGQADPDRHPTVRVPLGLGGGEIPANRRNPPSPDTFPILAARRGHGAGRPGNGSPAGAHRPLLRSRRTRPASPGRRRAPTT